ncbi:uncharacterized protein LOC127587163 [Pristis pectinata]|uniref:uncharacterized protein LOC127587163 n=1 Tax=Pristis pectinata TaxID=685728 RepID=UPI00223D6842|nr:uncharacterized protein LOC127587163 [Pristis pectinata]
MSGAPAGSGSQVSATGAPWGRLFTLRKLPRGRARPRPRWLFPSGSVSQSFLEVGRSPCCTLTDLHFTDQPSIFPAETVAGKPMNISCTFNTTCNGTAPNLTWVTPTDVPPPVSSSVTHWGDTLTYTSVLTLTPELKHHGENITCRVRYPSVSSEQTLTLTVQPVDQSIPVIPLAAAAGAVFLIISSAVICFILQTRQRTDRQLRGALRQVSEGKSGTMPIRERLKQEEFNKMYYARSRTAKEKAPKDRATTLNHHVNQRQGAAIYENCQFDNSPIYANV